ncbi:MAG: thioredoxin domain-containing protein [Anaerolineales bacterium]|nr:thioredoxin domain-containing protein [Anaerolineales bacterium]
MPNRLAAALSPYLLQHQDNPVDWYPWGEEALARAKAEDKPIFLSIGYAACHWCHVMAHESFENPATAQVMNELFINIKVDREERPDLDSIYMNAVVALTGHGGWPMSVFLTPAGVPFYGGTYFPPAPRGGMPAFTQILVGVQEAWQNRREQVVEGGQGLLEHLRQEAAAGGSDLPSRADLAEVAQSLGRVFDWRYHGWGGAPKFPQPMTLEFCLRYHVLTGAAAPLEMAVKTLHAMARGGMYDQLGGGFHRYATDAQWLVPHFEKMLYDNAQLARVYLHAWQVTREPDFRRVAEEVLDYIQREMTDPAGGFYSTTDADSEGEEGKFFVWSAAELEAALGADAPLFKQYYGVTPAGNFEGRSILFVPQALETVARKFNLTPAEAQTRLAAARQTLLPLREQRVRPGLDDKVLAGWNGLMLAAFAEAARVFDRDDYRRTAAANAEFLLTTLRGPDGRLWRAWRRGVTAPISGYLEDYANVAEGLVALYETTFDARYLTAARELLDHALERFADPAGGFFDTSVDHEALVVRPKDTQDNATPSGGAMAVTVLLKLAALTGEAPYQAAAERALAAVGPLLARYPTGFAQWLNALIFALGEPQEVALVGDPAGADLAALLAVVFEGYRPFQVVALRRPGEPPAVPLLAGREALAGRATAYVCENFACRLPVADPAELRAQLRRLAASAP